MVALIELLGLDGRVKHAKSSKEAINMIIVQEMRQEPVEILIFDGLRDEPYDKMIKNFLLSATDAGVYQQPKIVTVKCQAFAMLTMG
mmetsp:Transcript_24012/g.32205  ORF Transcript_24012/g.32205 Transcript_24012/m.32205 type:complete len:87 (+) Transcript_24012:229-489(+)|eukprot:CAMPEP_0185593104 /NCGR_PEP_ID=MMETSP0434-20130131/70382_1 /TAXON_ID=626734 ORGANISM="Favella taraikaensis, Strain Fe Narragansett Bay" /NCGR_SAMPLE_ID=MMETSP0434 /ASSEMBLY_ACC=CAM_ASM_000379 /LENGTH=86 /DNA_ID=CAMNT_0028219439 /DNA_START=217 /DNA_END=477 /DNA_ORIENTATION=+